MRRLSALFIAVAFAASACSSPARESAQSDKLAGFKKQTTTRLEQIEKRLDGLDPTDRRKKLIKLAQAEGGTLNLYGVTNFDEMGPVIDAFESDTGLTVNYFRANSTDILQRLDQEARAGFRGADAVNENGPEMTILDREGLLAPIHTPVSKQITPGGDQGHWIWSFIDTFTPAWNVNKVAPGQAPKTWEDVLTKYKGRLAMEVGDVDWFATLVKGYFMAQKHMTEQQAIDLFKQAARGATFVDGHTLMTELLASGEFDVAASPYLERVQQLRKDGAPIAWEPAVVPLVARPEGIAVHAAAEHPAAGLLFLEFYLTDAQKIGQELDRQPASTAVSGGGLPKQYKSITVDVQAVVNEFDKWSNIYDQIVRLSGHKVVSD